jgi:hypothetical protein
MKKKILYFTVSIISIGLSIYLFSFQAKFSIGKYRLQTEINNVDKISASLSELNKSMGKLETEPQKETLNKLKSDFKIFMSYDLGTYEPWFPRKKGLLLDSLSLMLTKFETSKDLENSMFSENFSDLRIKLLETEVYYRKLYKYNIEQTMTNYEYEQHAKQGFWILKLLSGLLFTLGMLNLYLGIKKIKTTRPNTLV